MDCVVALMCVQVVEERCEIRSADVETACLMEVKVTSGVGRMKLSEPHINARVAVTRAIQSVLVVCILSKAMMVFMVAPTRVKKCVATCVAAVILCFTMVLSLGLRGFRKAVSPCRKASFPCLLHACPCVNVVAFLYR